MKISMLFSLVMLLLMFSGCAPQGLYYFGNYSQTFYHCEKNQNEESYAAHKQELENIISESEKRNISIPPGIYAELGYIHFKANRSEEAIALFIIESELYPESRHLMERLIQSAKSSSDTVSN